jgi:hypothetical protein
MASVRVCDNCGQAISENNPAVAKIFLVPTLNGKIQRKFNNYTAHRDIGKCCMDREVTSKRWQKRRAVPSRGVRKVTT